MDVVEAARGWNDRMLASVYEPISAGALRAGSLLRPGASEQELDALERRLVVTLPRSYREFLSFSNGAYADWEVVPASEPRRKVSDPSIGLLPAGEVVRATDAVPEDIALWTEDAPESGGKLPSDVHGNGEEVGDFGPMSDSLLVSSLTWEEGKYFLCLAPVSIEDDVRGEGFELWDKGWSGATRYLSFCDWFELSTRHCWFEPAERYPQFDSGVTPASLVPVAHWPPAMRVSRVRNLMTGAPTPEMFAALEAIWAESYPFLPLAAAQVWAVLQPDEGFRRLERLADGDEPTVALGARASLRLLTA